MPIKMTTRKPLTLPSDRDTLLSALKANKKRLKACPQALALTEWGIEQLRMGLRATRDDDAAEITRLAVQIKLHPDFPAACELFKWGIGGCGVDAPKLPSISIDETLWAVIDQLLNYFYNDLNTAASKGRIAKQSAAWADAVQLARIKIILSIESYDPCREFRPWARKCALRRIQDAQKAERRHARKHCALPAPDTQEDALYSESAEDAASKAEGAAIVTDIKARLIERGRAASVSRLERGHARDIQRAARLYAQDRAAA